jgi:pimeloyl-ACP methyl ester carboxylesterase
MRLGAEMPRPVLHNFLGVVDPDIDVRPLLPTLRVPSLILQGAEDRPVTGVRAAD